MAQKTIRKTAWNNKSRTNVITGGVLTPNAATEYRYYAQLEHLILQMVQETETKLKQLFATPHAEEYFAQDASVSSQARILTNALTAKFNNLFASLAKPIATNVAKESDKSSDFAVSTSIREMSVGLTISSSNLPPDIKNILNATTTENVGLIKSIPAQFMHDVQGAVMRSITTGNGLQDLVPFLQKNKGVTLRRARMIATDQTRKAFNNLSKSRMQEAGIKEFIWLHTGGSNHPRKDHIAMSGNKYSFSDLPVIDENTGERGIPGQAINCRCKMKPVISFGKDDD